MASLREQIQALQSDIFEKQQALAQLRLEEAPELIKDYVFQTNKGKTTTLKALFGDADELLVIHNMGKSCVYCTMWADVLNGMKHIIEDRVKIILSSPDDFEVMNEFARSRNWNLACYSYAGTDFSMDLGFAKDKDQRRWYEPGVSALVRKNGKIYRTAKDVFGPGDVYCAPWHLFSLLPKGNKDWQPKYNYEQGSPSI